MQKSGREVGSSFSISLCTTTTVHPTVAAWSKSVTGLHGAYTCLPQGRGFPTCQKQLPQKWVTNAFGSGSPEGHQHLEALCVEFFFVKTLVGWVAEISGGALEVGRGPQKVGNL